MKNYYILLKIILAVLIFTCLLSFSKSKTEIPAENSSLNQTRQKVAEFFTSIKESKIFSQNYEDGVIMALISFLNLSKFGGSYVEFGTESATECNTRNLRENFNWTGLLMDGNNEKLDINLHKERILHSNVVDLFKKYKVNKEFDLFSEDTDYADYWIVESVIKEYMPKIVIHEVNQQLPDRCVTIPKPAVGELIFWDGSDFHGGSVCAFNCLAKKNGYTMVISELKNCKIFGMESN